MVADPPKFWLAQTPGLLGRVRRLRRDAALRALAPVSRIGHRLRRGAFGILAYHRVAHRVCSGQQPTWNVTPDRFERQLAGLLRRGFRPWPLRKALDACARGEAVPAKTFVVTFDDGYANVYRHAFPVLRRLETPATIFLATAYLDRREPFPFDDWRGAGSGAVPADAWLPLTTDACREMAASGLIELGVHTHTHQDFRGRTAEFAADLRASVDVLRDTFGVREPAFAFPYGTPSLGFCTREMRQAARACGVLCALTTETELARVEADPFGWGRFQVGANDSPGALAAQLAGWFDALRGMRRKRRKRVIS